MRREAYFGPRMSKLALFTYLDSTLCTVEFHSAQRAYCNNLSTNANNKNRLLKEQAV